MKPVLDAALPAPGVIQVGLDEAELTPLLLAYCRDRGAVAHLIDVPAKGRQRGPRERYGSSVVRHRKSSLRALEDVGRIDVVLIDGRRDAEKLYRELSAIQSAASRDEAGFPLVLLHGDLPEESRLAVERFLAETGLPLAFTPPEGENAIAIVAHRDADRSRAQAPGPVRAPHGQPHVRDGEPGATAARIIELERAILEVERERGGLKARLECHDADGARRARALERLVHEGTRIVEDIGHTRRAGRDLATPSDAPDLPSDVSPSNAIAVLDVALRRVRSEVAQLREERRELDRRLRERGEELLAAARARGCAEAALHAAQAGLGAAQAKGERDRERARVLSERLRSVEKRDRELVAALEEADRAADVARAERDEAEQQRAVAEADRLRVQRQLEELTWKIAEERELLAGHIRRIAQSRTWRYGHALALSVTLLTRRHNRHSAVDVMQARLEAPLALEAPPALEAPLALEAGPPSAEAVEPSPSAQG